MLQNSLLNSPWQASCDWSRLWQVTGFPESLKTGHNCAMIIYFCICTYCWVCGQPYCQKLHLDANCIRQVCVCARSYPSLCDPMDYILLGSSVHGIFQARILEWITISFSGGSSWPRNQTRVSWVSCIGRAIIYHCATWEACIKHAYALFVEILDLLMWIRNKNNCILKICKL